MPPHCRRARRSSSNDRRRRRRACRCRASGAGLVIAASSTAVRIAVLQNVGEIAGVKTVSIAEQYGDSMDDRSSECSRLLVDRRRVHSAYTGVSTVRTHACDAEKSLLPGGRAGPHPRPARCGEHGLAAAFTRQFWSRVAPEDLERAQRRRRGRHDDRVLPAFPTTRLGRGRHRRRKSAIRTRRLVVAITRSCRSRIRTCRSSRTRC